MPTTQTAFPASLSSLLCAASPAHHSTAEDTGHAALEHKQELAADVEGPQAPEEIGSALPLPVVGASVGRPAQFLVDM